jgi:hypothetical protein
VREDLESKSGKVHEEKGEEGKKKHKNTHNEGNARVQAFATRGVRRGLEGREMKPTPHCPKLLRVCANAAFVVNGRALLDPRRCR